jgi:O-antigen ligase
MAAVLIALTDAYTALQGTRVWALNLGSTQLYPFDLLGLLFGAAGAVLALQRRRLLNADYLIFIILVFSSLQFIRGFASYGVQAGLEFRQDEFVLGCMLFMSQVRCRYSVAEFAQVAAIIAGSALLVYALRALGVASLSEFDQIYNVGTFRGHRFIASDGALTLLGLSLSTVALAMRQSRPIIVFAMFGVAAIALAMTFGALHRSVWLAAFVALPLFVHGLWRARLISASATTIVFAASVLLVVALVAAAVVVPVVQESLLEVNARESSLSWRTEGWRGLLGLMSPSDYFIGRGYGSDYNRIVMGRIINASSHNHYLGKLFQLGIPGLVLYLSLYGTLALGLLGVRRDTKASIDTISLSILLFALLGGYLAFLTAYENWTPSAILFGYSAGFLAMLRQSAPESARARRARAGRANSAIRRPVRGLSS